jgi:hypothetical protein
MIGPCLIPLISSIGDEPASHQVATNFVFARGSSFDLELYSAQSKGINNFRIQIYEYPIA